MRRNTKQLRQLQLESFTVFNNIHDPEELINDLDEIGLRLDRDVIVSNNKNREGSLYALQDDFWFHSDGSFLKIPPRYIAVIPLVVDGGGDIELLDSDLIGEEKHSLKFFFGKRDESCFFPVHSSTGIFRYRKDYMVGKDVDLQKINRSIERIADRSIKISNLNMHDILLIDNWRMLHRRKGFTGERTIRRLWFSGEVLIQ